MPAHSRSSWETLRLESASVSLRPHCSFLCCWTLSQRARSICPFLPRYFLHRHPHTHWEGEREGGRGEGREGRRGEGREGVCAHTYVTHTCINIAITRTKGCLHSQATYEGRELVSSQHENYKSEVALFGTLSNAMHTYVRQ